MLLLPRRVALQARGNSLIPVDETNLLIDARPTLAPLELVAVGHGAQPVLVLQEAGATAGKAPKQSPLRPTHGRQKRSGRLRLSSGRVAVPYVVGNVVSSTGWSTRLAAGWPD